jgi:hypothetical protein
VAGNDLAKRDIVSDAVLPSVSVLTEKRIPRIKHKLNSWRNENKIQFNIFVNIKHSVPCETDVISNSFGRSGDVFLQMFPK